jgi:hypothetical protein
MRNLDGWMTGWMMGRMDGKDDHQGYYITRKMGIFNVVWCSLIFANNDLGIACFLNFQKLTNL